MHRHADQWRADSRRTGPRHARRGIMQGSVVHAPRAVARDPRTCRTGEDALICCNARSISSGRPGAKGCVGSTYDLKRLATRRSVVALRGRSRSSPERSSWNPTNAAACQPTIYAQISSSLSLALHATALVGDESRPTWRLRTAMSFCLSEKGPKPILLLSRLHSTTRRNESSNRRFLLPRARGGSECLSFSACWWRS